MAKNAGESRIPLPRTVRPSLLPKLRSLGPPAKIGSAAHRRSTIGYNNSPANKQQQQQQQQANNSSCKGESPPCKQPCKNTSVRSRASADKDKERILEANYSISAIWNATADNKETGQLTCLNDDKSIKILRSQVDPADHLSSIGKKRQQSCDEDLSSLSETGQVVSCSVENSNNVNNVVGCHNNNRNSGDFAIESPASTTTTPHYLMLTKQNSFEHDESSLGILTPDQMTDFTVALESSRTPSCENVSTQPNSGKFHLSNSNEVVAAAARHLDIATRLPSIEVLLSTHDKSPSLEELPLDPKPAVVINEDIASIQESLCAGNLGSTADGNSTETSEHLSKTTTIDSSETSDQTSDPLRCSVTSSQALPTSFITSVTSIASLEAGYQGDGENSRPASRGPEPLSVVSATGIIVSAVCRQDPMTDSDFFTESDADAHDDIVRGDRRAQVIDGRLFCAANERRCQSFEPGEEMDSSGVYSDFEKRQDSVGVDVDADEPEAYGDGDHTTTDTGDTEVSMKSQPSPVDQAPVRPLIAQTLLSPLNHLNETNDSVSTVSTAELTVIKHQKNEQNTAMKTKSSNSNNKENAAPLKKHKMPKRNVASKIKEILESNQNLAKEETESEPKRPRRNGRWDAVMNKIEAGKSRGRAMKKEVKSRFLQGLGTSSSSSASTSSTKRPADDAINNANNKDKRKAFDRPETSSLSHETARSSVRSSASDLSSAHSKETLKRPLRKNCPDEHQPNNNQINANYAKSNLSAVRKAPSIKSVPPVKQKNAPPNRVADRNNRATPNGGTPKELPLQQQNHHHQQQQQQNHQQQQQIHNGVSNGHILNNHQNHHLANNHNHNHNNNNNTHNSNHNNNNNHHNNSHYHIQNTTQQCEQSVTPPQAQSPISEIDAVQERVLQVERRDQEIQAQLQPSLEQQKIWCDKADNGLAALAVTVQYLTRQLENMKTEWMSARSELEVLRLRRDSFEKALTSEREQHHQVLASLRENLQQEQSERSFLEQSIRESTSHVEQLRESLLEKERQQRAALERLVAEHEIELREARATASTTTAENGTSPALLAEVESLRAVLELRCRENLQLRSDADRLRRELDDKEAVRIKAEALDARCEDLSAQLQSREARERELEQEIKELMGSNYHLSQQNKRLEQKKEELVYRLRQKNEISLSQNHSSPQFQRLSRSLEPSDQLADFNCSTHSEVQASSIMHMVQKSDSVSWTLDITNDSTHPNGSGFSPSSRRRNESNGSTSSRISRQSSMRLSSSRRAAATSSRASVSTASNGQSVRARANTVSVATPTSMGVSGHDSPPRKPIEPDESFWSPSCNSTPTKSRHRNVTGDQTWSLSGTVLETSGSCSSKVAKMGGTANASVVTSIEMSTTDEDEEDEEDEEEEEAIGQRPQEAGGEAMISEETSTSSSSEDDESSASSGDVP